MAKERWLRTGNKLVKQGNSYCIRVPKQIVNELKVTEGDWIFLKLQKANLELTKDHTGAYVKLASKIKELKQFSKEKISVFVTIAYNESMHLLRYSKGLDDDSKQELERLKKKQKEYREKIKKEFGDKVYADYNFFIKQIQKHDSKKEICI